MSDTSEDRAARRRAAWTGVVLRPGEPEPAPARRAAELHEVVELSVRSWLLAGRELPVYERHNAPGRVLRPWRS